VRRCAASVRSRLQRYCSGRLSASWDFVSSPEMDGQRD
jgi:hypothetical protein